VVSVTIGIYSPGAMGSALGRAWRDGGARVVTTIAGRSDRTRSLADGLELLADLDAVVDVADIVVSIGPPAYAVAMAEAIANAGTSSGRRPVVADLNAIAPTTMKRVAATVTAAGGEPLDGSISGGPPHPGGTTKLYLSGSSASLLADLTAPGLTARIVGEEIGTASAVKMCTASIYKGFTALLLQALRTAHVNGVTDIVLDDLAAEFGDLRSDAAIRLAMAAAKSDRYPGEMREIAAAQQAADGRPELFTAMAAVYEALAMTELAGLSPEAAARPGDLASVLSRLEKRSS
jgi:3-hydroxyisobutyrate dehydrogenase-like beta-hydroxyacid dehydrogenase